MVCARVCVWGVKRLYCTKRTSDTVFINDLATRANSYCIQLINRTHRSHHHPIVHHRCRHTHTHTPHTHTHTHPTHTHIHTHPTHTHTHTHPTHTHTHLCVVEVWHVPSLREPSVLNLGRGVTIVIVVPANHVPARL